MCNSSLNYFRQDSDCLCSDSDATGAGNLLSASPRTNMASDASSLDFGVRGEELGSDRGREKFLMLQHQLRGAQEDLDRLLEFAYVSSFMCAEISWK